MQVVLINAFSRNALSRNLGRFLGLIVSRLCVYPCFCSCVNHIEVRRQPQMLVLAFYLIGDRITLLFLQAGWPVCLWRLPCFCLLSHYRSTGNRDMCFCTLYGLQGFELRSLCLSVSKHFMNGAVSSALASMFCSLLSEMDHCIQVPRPPEYPLYSEV